MSSIQRYEFQGTGVRVVIIDGQPWFVAADVCGVLGLALTHRAIAGLADDEKGRHSVTTLGGAQSVSIVSRSGLYRLIFTSRKPEAYLVLLSATVEKGPRRGQYLQVHVTPAGIEKLMRLRHSIGGN